MNDAQYTDGYYLLSLDNDDQCCAVVEIKDGMVYGNGFSLPAESLSGLESAITALVSANKTDQLLVDAPIAEIEQICAWIEDEDIANNNQYLDRIVGVVREWIENLEDKKKQ